VALCAKLSYVYALQQLKLYTLHDKRYHLDAFFKFLLSISETFLCSVFTLQVKIILLLDARCWTVDVFGTKLS
jgi:hypothetical protein